MIRQALKATTIAVCCALGVSALAYGGAEDKKVWGGGDPKSSTYSRVYVPHIIDQLTQNRLAGYQWAGKSQGTVENAQRVSEKPTHLAVGQLDILSGLQGKEIPGSPGQSYAFTVLHKNIGPECLYAITSQEGFSTWGHVLGNAWDLKIFTGGKKSGSYGTLKRLMEIYPDLKDAEVRHIDGTHNIVGIVAQQPSSLGFFVMRPDPNSDVFKRIRKADLSLVPVVDFELENVYEFMDLKVAHGGFFSGAKFHTTACTSVALVTGDPAKVDASETRKAKRLQATIERIGSLNAETLKPSVASWRDMWDSLRSASADKLNGLMEQSKKALETASKKLAKQD